MLSVIIPTHNDAADLARLLGALVPAAVDGLVREVIVADAGSTDETLSICEDAGATVVAGGLVAAAGRARSDWVLLLPVEIDLAEDWPARMKGHLSRGLAPARLRGVAPSSLLARLRAMPAGVLQRREKVAGQGADGALIAGLGRGLRRI